MPTGPAARKLDPTMHPLPLLLQPGPASPDVKIGFLPAWRGVLAAVAQLLQGPKKVADTAIKVANAAANAAAGTPAGPAAKAAAELVKATALAAMSALINATPADKHACTTPLPVPPHGPGVVIDGSQTVLINNLAACRQGDTILEAIGPPNNIKLGCQTVIIGG
jgi:uncharacterized Zn-binding protein involved in type VI secretion